MFSSIIFTYTEFAVYAVKSLDQLLVHRGESNRHVSMSLQLLTQCASTACNASLLFYTVALLTCMQRKSSMDHKRSP
jgi:hypothetical protein